MESMVSDGSDLTGSPIVIITPMLTRAIRNHKLKTIDETTYFASRGPIVDIDVKMILDNFHDLGQLFFLQIPPQSLISISRHSNHEFAGLEMFHERAFDHVILGRQRAERLHVFPVQFQMMARVSPEEQAGVIFVSVEDQFQVHMDEKRISHQRHLESVRIQGLIDESRK